MYGKNSFLDKRINTPELVTIKSAIPLLEPGNRKMLSILIKLIEIRRLMDYLKETTDTLNKLNTSDDKRSALLELILPHLSPENQSQLQMMMTFMEVLKT